MFRTTVIPTISEHKITLDHSILCMGSCFAQNIGNKLISYKFDALVNPFGTLFNPISIFKLINQAVLKELINDQGLVENQGVFHHYDLHSDLSRLDGDELISNVNVLLAEIGNRLPSTDYVIYTFGTSIVYELKDSGDIVANCHKVPADQFQRRLLDINEIVHAFKVNYDLIKSINKNAHIILTVSPVRHQKESFEQNNISKSILRVACDQLVNHHKDVAYFPAFEIMMDELRDFRFYAEDMLHPNETATNFIWEKFQEAYFTDDVRQFVRKWEKMRKALAHRPNHPESERHQLFVKKTIDLLQEFKNMVDIDPEKSELEAQLI